MGAGAAYLLLTGGFAVSAGNALARKDAFHALLFAFLGLASAHLGAVPGVVLGAAWIAYVIAALLFGIRALVRFCTGADAFAPTLVATAVLSLAALLADVTSGPDTSRGVRLLSGKALHRGFSGVLAKFDGSDRLR